MAKRNWNWALWAGFLLAVLAFASYIFVFVEFPITRDIPWVNLLMFAGAGVLLIVGMRRAFQQPQTYRGKIAGPVLATLAFLIAGLFVFQIFIFGRQLPLSAAAPRVGARAPEFSLLDTSGQPVSLASLLSSPVHGAQPRGALLVFYRGYW
jgi:hypothetical protein